MRGEPGESVPAVVDACWKRVFGGEPVLRGDDDAGGREDHEVCCGSGVLRSADCVA